MAVIKWYKTNMTSNVLPKPYVASASSVLDNSFAWSAWKAFDGEANVINNMWISNINTGWLTLDFGTKTKVNLVSITPTTYASEITSSPKDFNILGSDDGYNFIVLKSFTGIDTWETGKTMEFQLDSVASYRYYRVDITKNNGYKYISIGEVAFGIIEYISVMVLKNPTTNQHYSLADKTLILLPDVSDETMINYGIEAGKEIKLDEAFDKIKQISEISEPVGNGKMFSIPLPRIIKTLQISNND